MNKTTDLWLTLFLKQKGYKIVKVKKLDNRRGEYHFKISPPEWEVLIAEFNDSQLCEIKYSLKQLSELIYY